MPLLAYNNLRDSHSNLSIIETLSIYLAACPFIPGKTTRKSFITRFRIANTRPPTTCPP